MAEKSSRQQQKQLNRELARQHKEKMSKMKDQIDPRSTYDVFMQWCDECTGGQLYNQDGVLSILGSDGIDLSDTRIEDAPINNPAAVDAVLEEWGYYESGDVMCGLAYYNAPKVHYLEWFNKKFN